MEESATIPGLCNVVAANASGIMAVSPDSGIISVGNRLMSSITPKKVTMNLFTVYKTILAIIIELYFNFTFMQLPLF
ncbi:MAG: hypothetical protein IJI25_07035 [Eubacterium sp.]|nr:hypothetical protein [Eubacterium sp.]